MRFLNTLYFILNLPSLVVIKLQNILKNARDRMWGEKRDTDVNVDCEHNHRRPNLYAKVQAKTSTWGRHAEVCRGAGSMRDCGSLFSFLYVVIR